MHLEDAPGGWLAGGGIWRTAGWRVHLEDTPGGRSWRTAGRAGSRTQGGSGPSLGPTVGGGRGFPGVTLGLAPEELFLSAVLEAEATWPQDSCLSLGAFVSPPPAHPPQLLSAEDACLGVRPGDCDHDTRGC